MGVVVAGSSWDFRSTALLQHPQEPNAQVRSDEGTKTGLDRHRVVQSGALGLVAGSVLRSSSEGLRNRCDNGARFADAV